MRHRKFQLPMTRRTNKLVLDENGSVLTHPAAASARTIRDIADLRGVWRIFGHRHKEQPLRASDAVQRRSAHGIIEGEQRRTGQGGIPIYNPTIARVKVHYDIFLDSYERQKNYQALTNRSLDELSSMRERADELILDIWNQVEAKYQDVTPNEDRLDKCRDYGLIYYYRSSEKVKEENELTC